MAAPRDQPAITPRADGTVAIAAGSHRGAEDEVWLVRYDPKPRGVLVKEGDNHGQTVTGHNVVRQLVKLGAWSGRRRVFHLPAAPEEGLVSLILVQGADGGRILAAGRMPA